MVAVLAAVELMIVIFVSGGRLILDIISDASHSSDESIDADLDTSQLISARRRHKTSHVVGY